MKILIVDDEPHLRTLIRQTLEGICKAHGARFVLKYERIGSVLSNNKAMADLACETAINLFGKRKVARLERASMGGEDFSEYLKLSPGCFIYIGTGSRALKTEIPWHHPGFDLDEKAMPVGSKLLAEISERFLNGGLKT